MTMNSVYWYFSKISSQRGHFDIIFVVVWWQLYAFKLLSFLVNLNKLQTNLRTSNDNRCILVHVLALFWPNRFEIWSISKRNHQKASKSHFSYLGDYKRSLLMISFRCSFYNLSVFFQGWNLALNLLSYLRVQEIVFFPDK